MRRAAAALILILLTACASPTETSLPGGSGSSSSSPVASGTATLVTPQPSSTPTPRSPTPKQTETPRPGESGTVTVAEDDSGKTIRLKVGQKLVVRLPSEYRPATAADQQVLVRTSATGGYPTTREMVAVFEARRGGQASVEASTDYACLHATPSCALPQRLWSVTVVVTR